MAGERGGAVERRRANAKSVMRTVQHGRGGASKRKVTTKNIQTYTAKHRTHFAQLRGKGGAAVAVVVAVVGRLDVDLPGGVTVEALVGGVAAPQALDQHGGGRYLPVEVLLALLLLYF